MKPTEACIQELLVYLTKIEHGPKYADVRSVAATVRGFLSGDLREASCCVSLRAA